MTVGDLQLPTAIKKEEKSETAVKEDLEKMMDEDEDEDEPQIKVKMHTMRPQQYETMIKNLRARPSAGVKLERNLQKQVEDCQAEIKREDHEEALARERGDRLQRELQRLQQLEIQEPTEVDGDEESSDELVQEHTQKESQEMAADDSAEECIGSQRRRMCQRREYASLLCPRIFRRKLEASCPRE
jgi:hypothetical protein